MRKSSLDWPKKHTSWINNRVLHVSIPFTWNLRIVNNLLHQRGFEWDTAVVGGPAVKLMPNFFDGIEFVTVGDKYHGALQRVNPMATKTTEGCVRTCAFCAVPQIEGRFRELDEWPNLPIIIDNNILASSPEHFNRVIDGLLAKWGWADFNQGLDSRLLNEHHANRLKELEQVMVRLALDSMLYADQWCMAFDLLRSAGISKRSIRSYALCGFDSGPDEAWDRCEFIESHGIKVLPMWFHALDCMNNGIVTDQQHDLGWNDYERRRLMQWFYQHKRAVKYVTRGELCTMQS